MQPERASTSHVILCFNSGSSSVKFALYRLGEVEEVQLAHGAVERIGLASGHLWIRGMDNAALVDVHRDFPEHAAAAEGIFVAAKDLGLPPPVAVGHRVVHGGPDHTAPERVDAPLLAAPAGRLGAPARAECHPGHRGGGGALSRAATGGVF
jgi:acetate kinase